MDMLRALSIYAAVYLARTGQMRTYRLARQWMETMNFRAATREELERHAKRSAEWADWGYTPQGAARHIEAGRSPISAAQHDARELGVRFDRPTEIRPALPPRV